MSLGEIDKTGRHDEATSRRSDPPAYVRYACAVLADGEVVTSRASAVETRERLRTAAAEQEIAVKTGGPS